MINNRSNFMIRVSVNDMALVIPTAIRYGKSKWDVRCAFCIHKGLHGLIKANKELCYSYKDMSDPNSVWTYWHAICGLPSWAAEGTNRWNRQQLANAHKQKTATEAHIKFLEKSNSQDT
jgi:hypothetical protein